VAMPVPDALDLIFLLRTVGVAVAPLCRRITQHCTERLWCAWQSSGVSVRNQMPLLEAGEELPGGFALE